MKFLQLLKTTYLHRHNNILLQQSFAIIFLHQDTFRALQTSITMPKDWRRRPGRPHHTWLEALNL